MASGQEHWPEPCGRHAGSVDRRNQPPDRLHQCTFRRGARSAVSQLSRSTGRNEAQVEKALETYNAASQVGTADGASVEAAREHTSVYGRTREGARYDFAERSGKLDAQREVGTSGTRAAARIGEERRQADNSGFASGAAAVGTSVREAARLDSFIQTLSRTSGNQTEMAEGGAAGIADRASNERLGRIVENERLTRAQRLLADHGVRLSTKEIAMDQNGDLNLNLTAQTAAAMWKGGLINEPARRAGRRWACAFQLCP
jgi:conjugal transfer mating pair stabilization protein TraG